MQLMKTLLVTGFEPFGGSPINPSEKAVQILQSEGVEGFKLETAILPVDSKNGPAAVLAAIDHYRPQLILCTGQAARRPALSIERVAINLMEYAIPDNSGNRIIDEPIIRDGQAAYFVTLPVRKMYTAVLAAKIPVELSLTAGAFLCNQVLYTVLHDIALRNLDIQAGFIHLPSLPEQVCETPGVYASMSLEDMLCGLRAAISAL